MQVGGVKPVSGEEGCLGHLSWQLLTPLSGTNLPTHLWHLLRVRWKAALGTSSPHSVALIYTLTSGTHSNIRNYWGPSKRGFNGVEGGFEL